MAHGDTGYLSNPMSSKSVCYYDLVNCHLAFTSVVRDMDAIVTKFDTFERGDVYLRISINPSCRLNVLDVWVKVTLIFSGDVGHHTLSQTVANKQNMNMQSIFPANGHNRVIANYVNLFNDSGVKESTTGVLVERFKGDELGVKYGFIEKLEFEVV
ncbi:hypothetical protein Fcan01_00161 [Folsomia candida]|uniref:Uncharacterized protein n=1 Tax=Folsomia candida TaxID=158441 RepID=A0A226F2B3_FOLCA|nr:hypothetical protein Fcan01_00161 [Folsomia candida]